METLEDLAKCWKVQKHPSYAPLNTEVVGSVITMRAKREQRAVREYFTVSFFWQLLVYAFMSHFIIRFWGDWQFTGWCMAGIVLYVPFTVIFMKKFKAMGIRDFGKHGLPVQDIYNNLKTRHTLLTEFYHFKSYFDWIGIPLSCFILLVILFKLYADSGVETHVMGASILYAFILGLFVVATWFENKKRFKEPLHKLKLLIQDMEKQGQ